jgi:integrase-like protein
MRRDDRVGMERRGSWQTAALHPAISVEGPRHSPEGRAIALRADHIRLASALRDHRHLKSGRVLCQQDRSPLTQDIGGDHVSRTGRQAQPTATGAHRLRHTFCWHLPMRGTPARAIQELAGHQDLTTTQRYMHLSPAALDHAIRWLRFPSNPTGSRRHVGDGGCVIRYLQSAV